MKKNSKEYLAGYEAARILYEDRYNFIANPERQCLTARRLAVQCPTCWASEFNWCRYVNRDDYTKILHVSRQSK